MSTLKLDDPIRRLMVLIGLVVVLFIAAIALGTSRYQVSHDSAQSALQHSQTQLLAQQARTAITDEGGIADAYGGDKAPADLADLKSVKADLSNVVEQLKSTQGLTAAQRGELDAIVADQATLDQIFKQQLAPVAGTPQFDQGVAPYADEVTKLEQQLDAFISTVGQQSAAAVASSNSDASSARTISIIAAILATLAAIGVAVYARRLIRDLFGKIDQQFEKVDQQLVQLQQIRTTADSLTEAAN